MVQAHTTVIWDHANVYLGKDVPAEDFIWQDPVPKVDHKLIDEKDTAALKDRVMASGLSVSDLVSTAWAAASTFLAVQTNVVV